jgi:hypothetical protein
MSAEANLEAAPQEGESVLFETVIAVFDFVVGGVGAVTLPFITEIHMANLPTGLQGHFTSHVIWLIVCFLGSVVVRNLLLIPRRVKADMRRLKVEMGRAFYNGFYALTVGDVRAGLQQFDKSLTDPKLSGPARELIFGFMGRSIAHIGQSGLAMVNAQVGEYVDLLNRLLLLPNQRILATCVVRPYWFVLPEIPNVTLPLQDKASHLVPFRAYTPSPIRIAVYDERTIGEILLTGFIDRKIFQESKTKCPNCIALKHDCPVHSGRHRHRRLQIPEISWFEDVVNKVQGHSVDLKYTHVRHEGRHVLSKLEDRVFVASIGTNMPLDVRFSFTNLSAGTLWLKWGAKAQNFDIPERANDWGEQVFRIPGEHAELGKSPLPHKIYQHFWLENESASLLRTSTVNVAAMRSYLGDILAEHVSKNFETGRKTINYQPHTDLLQDGIKIIVLEAIAHLNQDLETKTLWTIYKELVDHYRSEGVCDVAYVVSYDKAHPDVPVAAVRWNENWRIVSRGG